MIDQLFERSKSGLSFYGNTKDEIGARLNSLFYMDQFDKLNEFLRILQILATSKEYNILNASGIALVIQAQDTKRIDAVYKYVRDHFTDVIQLDEIATEVSMTIPSFCRYFKKLPVKHLPNLSMNSESFMPVNYLAKNNLLLQKYVLKAVLIIFSF